MNQAVPQSPLFTQGALATQSKAETEVAQPLGSPGGETPTGKKSKRKKNKRRGSKNANGNESAPPTPVEEDVAVEGKDGDVNAGETEEQTTEVVDAEVEANEAEANNVEATASVVVVEKEATAVQEATATVMEAVTQADIVKTEVTETVTETVTATMETATEAATTEIEVVAAPTLTTEATEVNGESSAVVESSQEDTPANNGAPESPSLTATLVNPDAKTPTMTIDSPKKANDDLATLLDLPSPVAATAINGSAPLSPTLAFLDDLSSDVSSAVEFSSAPATSVPQDISDLFASPTHKPAPAATPIEINALPDPFALESIPSLHKPINLETIDDPFAEEPSASSITSASITDESAAISQAPANAASSALFTSSLSPVLAPVDAPVELPTISPPVGATESSLADDDSFQTTPPPAPIEASTTVPQPPSTAIDESVSLPEAASVMVPDVEPVVASPTRSVTAVSEDEPEAGPIHTTVDVPKSEVFEGTGERDVSLIPNGDIEDTDIAYEEADYASDNEETPEDHTLVGFATAKETIQTENDDSAPAVGTNELIDRKVRVDQTTLEATVDDGSLDLTEDSAGARSTDEATAEACAVESVELTHAASTTHLHAVATDTPSPTSLGSHSVSESEDEPAPASPSSPSPPPAPVAAKASAVKSVAAKRTNGVAASARSRVPIGKPAVATKSTSSAPSNPPLASKRPTASTNSATVTGATTTPPVRSRPAPLQRSLSAAASTTAKKISTITPPKGVSPGSRTPPSMSPRPPARSPSAAGDSDVKVPKKKLSASEIEAAGNRLYEQAMESKRRLEAKKAQLDEAFTFAPQVNAKSKKLDNTDAPDRFSLLHERAKEAQRKKEELREKLEKEHCTFKPQITTKAKKISTTTDKPRYENLYKHAQEIQAKREERKKLEAEKKEEELTFKPKIKTTKSPVRSRPLYDPELVKQRRLELEQKKMEAELQAKPKTVRKARPDGDSKIFDRLYQAGQQRAERIAKLKQEREEAEKAQATFQPKLSTATNARSSKQPFHQRLYDKDYLKKVAAEREQKKLEEEKQRFLFKPRVSDKPDSVKSKGSSEGGSTSKSSIFERLYSDKDRVKEKIEMSEELKIQKEMEECTFRPHIDVPAGAGNKSEPSTPIWERLLSVDKNQIAEERERLKAQQEMEACTFRPEISPTPGSVSPKRASTHSIFERLSSTSGGSTPADDKKRRMSESKLGLGGHGKRNSYSERVSPKLSQASPQNRALSIGDVLKSSKLALEVGASEDNLNGGQNEASLTRSDEGQGENALNVVRSLEKEFSDDSQDSQPKSILENYDTWAASLEEKMRNL